MTADERTAVDPEELARRINHGGSAGLVDEQIQAGILGVKAKDNTAGAGHRAQPATGMDDGEPGSGSARKRKVGHEAGGRPEGPES